MVGQLRFGHNSRHYNDLEFLNAKHYGIEPWRCYHFLNLLSEGKIFPTLRESLHVRTVLAPQQALYTPRAVAIAADRMCGKTVT